MEKRQIDKQGTATVSELGKLGKSYAKSRVPYYSGDTYRAIKRRTLKTKEGPQAVIFISPKQPQDGNMRNWADFDLVYWMHYSSKARNHIKSGDPQFMFNTEAYLNKIRKGIAKGKFDLIKIK